MMLELDRNVATIARPLQAIARMSPCATAVLRKCCQRRVAAGNCQARLPV